MLSLCGTGQSCHSVKGVSVVTLCPSLATRNVSLNSPIAFSPCVSIDGGVVALLQASIWQAGWIKQGRINRNTTSVSAYYGNYTASGCEVQPSDTQKPGVQCPGPWNWGLTPAQFDAYRDNRRRTLLKDYGWDKA